MENCVPSGERGIPKLEAPKFFSVRAHELIHTPRKEGTSPCRKHQTDIFDLSNPYTQIVRAAQLQSNRRDEAPANSPSTFWSDRISFWTCHAINVGTD